MEARITHLILEFFGCQCPLADAGFIKRAVQEALMETELTELHSYFHTFEPPGVTGVIVLRESHIAIHTWPELQYAAVDLFTCGSREDALRANHSLIESLQPRDVKRQELRRGTAT
jgi:S-adenosylmethionine decarboxylase